MNVLILNAQGLSPSKLSLLPPLFDTFDIICVQETWFMDFDTMCSSPFFFLSSPLPPPPRTGHRPHGLALFVSPLLRPSILSSRTSPLALSIFFSAFCLHFPYLPPSLTPDNLAPLLRPPLPLSIIAGDFNVRLPASSSPSPGGRGAALLSASLRHSLALLPPVPPPPSPSLFHVLSPPSIPCSWSLIPCPVPSDHSDAIHLLLPPAPPPVPSSPRLYLKGLSDPSASSLLSLAFDALVPCLSPLFDQASLRFFALPPLSSAQRVCQLETLSVSLAEATFSVGLSVLGSYLPSSVRSSRDPLPRRALRRPDPSTAIRLYKRSLRSKAVPIISRDPLLSPLADATLFTETLYAQPNPLLRWIPPEVPLSEGSLSLADLFAPLDVWNAIRRYPTHKAPGPDCLPPALIRALAGPRPSPDVSPSSFLLLLSSLFRYCALNGATPPSWNTALVTPIPKKGLASSTIDNCRPISLTPLFRRIFESILLRHIRTSPECPSLRFFSRCQAGFRSGFSTLSHAALLSESLARGQSSATVFLDIAKAYDTVPVPLVLSRLLRRHADRSIVSLCRSLFTGCSMIRIVNHELSPPIPLERGLLQGSVLAPWLFNIFIDPLAHLLDSTLSPLASPSPPALFFADDIALCPSSPATSLQRGLDLCHTWASTNGLTFSVRKSAFVSDAPCPPPSLAGSPLPALPTYDYLGLPWTPRGFDLLSYIDSRCSSALGHLRALNVDGRFWPPLVRLLIYKVFVRSTLDYALPLLHFIDPDPISPSFLHLANVQRAACDWILGLPASHANRQAISEALLGLPPINDRARVLASSFALSLDLSPRILSANNPLCSPFFTDPPPPSPFSSISFSHKIPYAIYFLLLRRDRSISKNSPTEQALALHRLSYEMIANDHTEECRADPPTSRRRLLLDATRLRAGADAVLRAPPKQVTRFIRWRLWLYRFPATARCKCDSSFSSKHVACFLRNDPSFAYFYIGLVGVVDDTTDLISYLLNVCDFSEATRALDLLSVSLPPLR